MLEYGMGCMLEYEDIQYHDAYHDQYVTGQLPNPTCILIAAVTSTCAQACREVTLRVTLVLIETSLAVVLNGRCGKLYTGHPRGDRPASAQSDYPR